MAKKPLQERDAAFRREVVDKLAALVTAAFGLVAALAWNSAIQAVFKRYYPAPGDATQITPLLAYAIVVTVFAVGAIIWVGRVAARLKVEEKAEEQTA